MEDFGTHSVLAGHTGLTRMKVFDDINKLEIGDEFFIYVMDEILKYKVDYIVVVEPNDTDTIKIEEDKDYVTLVTCTPYLLNTHRLLVRGERDLGDEDNDSGADIILDMPAEKITLKTITEKIFDINTYKIDTIIKIILVILIIILIVLTITDKKKRIKRDC